MNSVHNKEVKGVILAAGYGTRFLPASKTVPKELFPLVDVPAIDFIVKEFIASGIDDILIITSRRKKVLEDYLDHELELETILQNENALEKLAKIAPLKANFHFIRQREMKGTADALLLSEPFCGDSPFVVAYPDDLIFSEKPCTQQMIEVYKETGKIILSACEILDEDISRYGVIEHGPKTGRIYPVKSLVEKPKVGTEPSRLVSFGRYLYTSDIFPALRELTFAPHQETSQTDPINQLAAQGKVLAYEFEGERYDVGAPLGYLTTIVKYAMTRPDLAPAFRKFLCKEYGDLLSGATF